MEKQQYTSKIKQVFTPKRIKIIVAVLVVCAIAAGGGAWYRHQQKAERRTQIQAAQTRVIQYQADQQHLALIDENKAKEIAASVIGKDAASLTFTEVKLENKWDDDDFRKGEHKKDKKDRGQGQPPQGPQAAPNPQAPAAPAPAPGQAPADTAQPQPQPAAVPAPPVQFLPVYDIEVRDGAVEYDIEINAVTGDVLQSKVDH